MTDEDGLPTDPQLRAYYTMTPEQYAHAHDCIAIEMRLSRRRCVGGRCDDEGECSRHERSTRVAERYLRMKRRARS
jgi:hypothetical protein